MSSNLSDMRDQGDVLTRVTPPGPVQRLAAELYIAACCTSLGDQRDLTEMLGLDAEPAPRTFSSAARRAVPDSYRRGRKTGGRNR